MSQNKYLNQLLDDVGASGPYPNTNKQKESALQTVIAYHVRFRRDRDRLYLWEGTFLAMFDDLRTAGVERVTLDGNAKLCADYANWIRTTLIDNKTKIGILKDERDAEREMKDRSRDHWRMEKATRQCLELELITMRENLARCTVELLSK